MKGVLIQKFLFFAVVSSVYRYKYHQVINEIRSLKENYCEGMNIIFKNYKNISIFPIINAIYNRWLPRFSHRFCDSSIFLFFASILNNDGCKIYRLALKCARIWTSIKTTFPFDLHASFKNKILVYFVKIYLVDFL